MTSKKQLRTGERAALLIAASGNCYNPHCDKPVMEKRKGHHVVNFEIAHIRDELPPKDKASDVGWRYWPAGDLTQAERNQFANLLMLCPPCHKLIDRVEPRNYTVELLHEWKAPAEEDRGAELEASLGVVNAEELQLLMLQLLSDAATSPMALVIPEPSREPDLLSFADRAIPHVGMDSEVAALQHFLASPDRFSWWLMTGDAGASKSRLALELCLSARGSWHAGFLPEASQESFVSYTCDQPTLGGSRLRGG